MRRAALLALLLLAPFSVAAEPGPTCDETLIQRVAVKDELRDLLERALAETRARLLAAQHELEALKKTAPGKP